MNTVRERISKFSASLTPSETKVAEYCLSHPEDTLNSSIYEVAAASGVSIASVSRLASCLGYKDWKEMRLSLAKDAGSSASANPIFPDIADNDSDEAVIDKVFNGNIQSLCNTLRQLERRKILRVVTAVSKTDRVLFFGSGGSGYLAKDEALRFSHLTPWVEAYTEDYQMMLQAAKMRKGQVAFGFSNSGRTACTVNVLTEARRHGAMTIGIANYLNTPLEDACDVFFCTSFPRGGALTASLTARVALLSIMDAIYVLAGQRGVTANVDYMNKVLENNLRLPPRKQRAKRK